MGTAKEFLDTVPPPDVIRARLRETVNETAALRKLLKISESNQQRREARSETRHEATSAS